VQRVEHEDDVGRGPRQARIGHRAEDGDEVRGIFGLGSLAQVGERLRLVSIANTVPWGPTASDKRLLM
jgi:hypothetical protein